MQAYSIYVDDELIYEGYGLTWYRKEYTGEVHVCMQPDAHFVSVQGTLYHILGRAYNDPDIPECLVGVK